MNRYIALFLFFFYELHKKQILHAALGLYVFLVTGGIIIGSCTLGSFEKIVCDMMLFSYQLFNALFIAGIVVQYHKNSILNHTYYYILPKNVSHTAYLISSYGTLLAWSGLIGSIYAMLSYAVQWYFFPNYFANYVVSYGCLWFQAILFISIGFMLAHMISVLSTCVVLFCIYIAHYTLPLYIQLGKNHDNNFFPSIVYAITYILPQMSVLNTWAHQQSRADTFTILGCIAQICLLSCTCLLITMRNKSLYLR